MYISMGSTAELTPQLARGLLEGVMTGTSYSVVWALRESNRECLEGLHLNTERVFLAGWVAQVAMLKHEAVAMAILHCGIGGVQEALINKVPVICLPYAWDQFATAIRLVSQGLGVRLLPDEVSEEKVKEAIHTIEEGGIRSRVEKISKVMKMGGGVDTAADLVEFYAAVGHDHGIPAFVRYQWSWVQYYNVDVWLVIVVLVGVVSWVCVRLCRCCCRCCIHRCCSPKTKTKKE